MEFNNKMPIYLQVIQEIKKEIVKGHIKLGEKLPSARELAMQYQINPNTSNRVYREIEQMQLCFTKRGLGTYVTEDKNKLIEIQLEMANEVIDVFIQEMNDLGYSKDKVMSIINEKYETVKGERTCYQQEML